MKDIIRAYWPSVAVYKKQWAIAFFGHTIFFSSARVLLPYVFASFVGKVSGISEATELSEFYKFIGLVVAVHAGQTAIGQFALRAMIRTAPLTFKHLEGRVYRHLTLRSAAFYTNNFTGSIVTKFNRFSRSFDTIFQAVLFEGQAAVVEFLLPFVFMLFISPVIAAIYLVWALFMLAILIMLHRKKLVYSTRKAAQESRKTGLLADTLTNIIPLKMFSSRPQEVDRFDKDMQRWAELATVDGFFGNKIRLFKVFMWTLLEAVTMYFIAREAVSGDLEVTNALAMIIFVRQMSQTMWNIGKVVQRLEQAVADAQEMIDILDTPIEVVDIDSPEELVATKGDISCQDVGFTYDAGGSGSGADGGDLPEGQASAVFRSLSLDIPAKQKVGLVGPSGGGKTTFVKLLLRFSDVQSGSINIDGQDISQVAQDDLRRAISYVPQEPILFHRTIAENISYGMDNVSDKRLAEIVRLSHVAEFVDQMPKGMDTMVGERGIKLSGGQKQRIAIARAMLKPAPILVLDEATSALDSKSEKLIVDALDNLMKGRTTIIIAHRLSTIKKLDRIIVLDKGAIEEDGTHQQLLRKKGIYANLWTHQIGDFIED